MTIAKAALWIAESQLMREAVAVVCVSLDFFSLKFYKVLLGGWLMGGLYVGYSQALLVAVLQRLS